MNAWRVGDADVGVVFVRAETRAQARRSWPGQDYAAVPVRRAPRLDGPGPARELNVVYEPCTDDEDVECFDGERIDWPRTIAAARGGTGDDGRMLPDGPLMRWLSGEDSEPDAALVQRIGKSLVQWSSPGWGGNWTDDQLAELLSDDGSRRYVQRGVDAILDALKQEAGRAGRDAPG